MDSVERSKSTLLFAGDVHRGFQIGNNYGAVNVGGWDRPSVEKEEEQYREDFVESLRKEDTFIRESQIAREHKATLQWIHNLQDDEDLTQWLNAELDEFKRIFWIKGKPGSGKSTLMKYMLRHTQKDYKRSRMANKNVVLAGFFFHDRGSDIQKSLNGLLHAIIYQILWQLPTLIPLTLATVAAQRPGGKILWRNFHWTSEALQDAFLTIITQDEMDCKIIFFIDALDEYNGRDLEIAEYIKSVTVDVGSRTDLRLCVSSRDYPAFQTIFSGSPGFAIHDMTKADVATYVQDNLSNHPSMHKWISLQGGRKKLEELTAELTDKANGVWIWVRLVVVEFLDALTNHRSLSELIAIVASLPTELEGLYKRILQRLIAHMPVDSKTQRKELYVMLEFVLRSRRPSSAVALYGAVMANTNPAQSKRVSIRTDDGHLKSDVVEMRIKAQCGGLLEVGPGNGGRAGNVEFLHQSAKEFVRCQQILLISLLLYDQNRDNDENGHMYWLKDCEYGLASGIGHPEFFDVFHHAYSVEEISPHTRIFPLDTILPFWIKSGKRSEWLYQLTLEQTENSNIRKALLNVNDKTTGLLIIATNTGLLRYSQFILETQDIDVSRVTPRPLLHWTCGPRVFVTYEKFFTDRKVAIAELLIQRGALVNAVYQKQTALQYMLTKGERDSYETAELCLCLLNHGATTKFVVELVDWRGNVTDHAPAVELLARHTQIYRKGWES